MKTIRESPLDSIDKVTQALPRTRIGPEAGGQALGDPRTILAAPPCRHIRREASGAREGSKAGMFLFFREMAREGYVTHQDLRKAMQATFLSSEKGLVARIMKSGSS